MFGPSTDRAGIPEVYRRGARPFSGQQLTSDINRQVVVIGAGFTGLSAALHLAEAGMTVAILEAEEVGWGASGRNFGQVVPYTKHSEDHLLKHYGAVQGERLIEATAHAPDLVFSLVQRLGIECDAVREGLFFASHSASGLAGLKVRAAFWQKRGAPVELVEGAAVASATGSNFYDAALLDKRGGVLNPFALACGLAHACVDAGVTIYTGARAKGMAATSQGWAVTTAGHSASCDHVVVATDAYTDAFAPQLRSAIIPMRAYQLISSPLGDNARKQILPNGQSLTDTRRLYSGIRMHSDGRLHVSVDGPAFSDGAPFKAKATERVRRLYPFLSDISWQESWSGWVGMTTDQYPRLVEIRPGCYAALGYSGRGVALATLLGRELALLLTGTARADLVLPVTGPESIAFRPFLAPLVGSLVQLYRVLDKVDDDRLARSRL